MFSKSRAPLLVADVTTGGVKGGRAADAPTYNSLRQFGHGGSKKVNFKTRWRRSQQQKSPNWKYEKPKLPIYAFATGGGASTASSVIEQKAFEEGTRAQKEYFEASKELGVAKEFPETVAVWYHPNDLRLHDHYPCALAVDEAELRGCPVVAMFCFDIRTFAQPSLLGGFYRQSPMRAQYLIKTVENLRDSFRKQGTELFVRVGYPEVEIPLLAKQLGCSQVFSTTQYAPHEKFVQDKVRRELSFIDDDVVDGGENSRNNKVSSVLKTCWNTTLVHVDDLLNPVHETPDRFRVFWDENQATRIRPTNPYDCSDGRIKTRLPNFLNKHLHEDGVFSIDAADESLVSANRFVTSEEEQQQEQDLKNVSVVTVGASSERKYGVVSNSGKLHEVLSSSASSSSELYLPLSSSSSSNKTEESINNTSNNNQNQQNLLKNEKYNIVPAGALPNLRLHLGYGNGTDITSIEDQGDTHFGIGEDFILNDRLPNWLTERQGLREYTALAYHRHTRIIQDGRHQGRLSFWLSNGSLSPRKLYETLREFSYNKMGQGTTEGATRELHQRLMRRDFWHFLGVKYGRAFFFPYGPRPDETDDVPDPRIDRKIIQRWCAGLTGMPFVDASMKELSQTGWANVNSRKAMIWTLTRGYGQDWRIGAEWMERNMIDYDPFVCYGCCMFESGIIKDRFFDKVQSANYIAQQNDGTGVYTKRWLPLLSNVPDYYLHRVHVMTKKMQKMHNVILGKNYPYPIKLWDGALEEGRIPLPLPGYFTDVDEHDHLHPSSTKTSSADNNETTMTITDGTNKNTDGTADDTTEVSTQQKEKEKELEEYEKDLKNRFNNDIREQQLVGKISSVHIEARRAMNLIDNKRIGWGEAKRHNRNLLEEPLFGKKTKKYDANNDQEWSGIALDEQKEKMDKKSSSSSSSYSLLLTKSEVFPVLSEEAVEIGEKVESGQLSGIAQQQQQEQNNKQQHQYVPVAATKPKQSNPNEIKKMLLN